MADVSTYRRCTATHYSNGYMYHEGDVKPSTDPDVALNPQWWVALTDAVMADASLEVE